MLIFLEEEERKFSFSELRRWVINLNKRGEQNE